ncbi:MAG: hypothetical protein CYPHOPRED_004617 [Cyphobasidiales sp. Tagirdzhanova-0007]|nr:MAG: hypothetical protein CYPHOPRED_004617 [Cyphobasidiales sp. Tagirdzhanova-0007]
MDKDYNPDQGLPNPESADTKDTGNVIGGLKASLNNDGHSDAAKSSDKERLEALAQQGAEGLSK